MALSISKESLIASFQDTLACANGFVLSQRTRQSMMLTSVYEEGMHSGMRVSDQEGMICFLPMTTFEAARAIRSYGCEYFHTFRNHLNPESADRIAVLNFANPVEPGGGVSWGAMAQEECLCRSSNLYPCLAQKKVRQDYYQQHEGALRAIASDRVVYVPDVTIFKSDDILPQNLSVEDWIQVDVLTCAAPFYPGLPDRTDAYLLDLYKSRIQNIFECAINNQADILILGAFGCGAFKNPSYLMAQAFCDTIREEDYLHAFSVIAFAIPEDGGVSSQNLRAFENVFLQRFPSSGLITSEKWDAVSQNLQSTILMPSGKKLQGRDLDSYRLWREKNPFEGKWFSILGDSISTFEGTVPDDYAVFYEKEMRNQSGVRKAYDTWWSQAVRFLGGRVLVDNAWSGSRATPLPGASKRFPSGCSSLRAGGLHLGSKKPDVILIFLGVNDWANGVPVYPEKEKSGLLTSLHRAFYGKKERKKREMLPPTFIEAYEAILAQVCKYYPNAELWCCTPGSTYMREDPEWSFPRSYAGIPIDQYGDAIRSLAGRYGAGIIDFAESGYSFETVDGSHPTSHGMLQLAMHAAWSLADDEGRTFLSMGECGEMKNEVISNTPGNTTVLSDLQKMQL